MKNILTVSNTISLLRGPLAFLFLLQSVKIRILAIICAMLSDFIDGYLARKSKTETFLGKVLDPVMDKFFVIFVIGILTYEGSLSPLGVFALLSRDVAIFCYVVIVTLFWGWNNIIFRAVIMSKITTGLQFLILLALVLQFSIPNYLYTVFFVCANYIFLELLFNSYIHKKTT